jgi:hypothetical protein
MFFGISKKDGLMVCNGRFLVIFGITKHFMSIEYSGVWELDHVT